MSLGRETAAVLGLAVLVAAAAVAPAVAVAERGTTLPDHGTSLAADSTSIQISVRPDGHADWTVQYRTNLDEGNATAFRRLQRRVERTPLNYTGPFAEQMREGASLAAAETGRSMAIQNVTVQTRELSTGYGVVTYRFTWTNFAARTGDGLVIGDALVGFFLGSEDTKLTIQWPAGYDLDRVSPPPDEQRDRVVIWQGPVEFAPDEPRVAVSAGGPLPAVPVAVLTVALVVVAAAGWHLRGHDSPLPSPTDWRGDTDAEAAPAGEDANTDADPEVPSELLSDSERVLNLVEQKGGRMKQQAVVEELGWSETKTSQVVNDLKDEGELEVYRIGRENVVSLPGEIDV